jgi:hypothetical protein
MARPGANAPTWCAPAAGAGDGYTFPGQEGAAAQPPSRIIHKIFQNFDFKDGKFDVKPRLHPDADILTDTLQNGAVDILTVPATLPARENGGTGRRTGPKTRLT